MLNRRTILAAGAGAVAMPHVGRAQAKTVTFAAYVGIFKDNYLKAVVEPFEKAHPDIKINYYEVANSAAMLGLLRAQKADPQFDVALMDVSVAKAGSDEGIFTPLDKAKVPALAELHPTAFTEGVHGPAVTFDNLVLVYDTKAITTPPTSWRDLWNPAYKGKVLIPAVPDIQGTALTILADRMEGGTDWTKSVDKGIAYLGKLAPNVQTWDPKPDSYQPIINDQAVIGIGWNARAQLFSNLSNGKLGVVLPSEGSIFQINTINLVNGGKNRAGAETFINYALSQPAQKSFTETMFYAPTNAKAVIAEAALKRTAVGAMDKMVAVNWLEVAKVRDSITEKWRRQVIPLSR